MADLFGVYVATTTIASTRPGSGSAASLQEPQTQWLHIAATTLLTFYCISPKRGDMLENLAGIAVAAAPNPAPLTIPASTTHR
jgi:hypothetical protein